MEKIEALERIKNIWNDPKMKLGEKIIGVSSAYYSVGLDLAPTAAYIDATPAELDALLGLGGLSDELIDLISEINPPETTWILLANAGEEEIKQALDAIKNRSHSGIAISEFVYQQMLEVAGPSPEQRVGLLTGDEIKHASKKGADFGALNDKESKFLKSIATQKKQGKTLTSKQLKYLMDLLLRLADKGAIVRNSIDGDKEICDNILDALGR